jgi:hypothetical protein
MERTKRTYSEEPWDAGFRAGHEAGQADAAQRLLRQARRAVEIADARYARACAGADPADEKASLWNLLATLAYAGALGLREQGADEQRARGLGWIK